MLYKELAVYQIDKTSSGLLIQKEQVDTKVISNIVSRKEEMSTDE